MEATADPVKKIIFFVVLVDKVYLYIIMNFTYYMRIVAFIAQCRFNWKQANKYRSV